MRFIKKAGIENLNDVSQIYKEIELHTTREDFSDQQRIDTFITRVKEVYVNNKAVITVVHCPSSRWKTSIDHIVSTNYMSFCEVVSTDEDKELFIKICDFANQISEIYSQVLPNITSDYKRENTMQEIESGSKSSKAKITVILHTGCVLGCRDSDETSLDFECPFNVDDRYTCFQNDLNNNMKSLINDIIKFENIQIGFENITPFCSNNNVGCNSGYLFENISLAKMCNKTTKDSTDKFGIVIDFCHIMATNQLLAATEKTNDTVYLQSYFEKMKSEDKELIFLFHLSNYKEDRHGESFTEDEYDKLSTIREICLKNKREAPITLEVKDSEKLQKGVINFNNMMLEWSKIHLLLRDKVDKELFNFFESLFGVYSKEYNKSNKATIVEEVRKLKDFIISNSYGDKKLLGFSNDGQRFNIYLFQVQAYVCYMRYCNLALDLIDKYSSNISSILKYYLFNNELEEIKFDGIGYYYNIYWVKRNKTLYRCYDGVEPSQNKYENFKDILEACFNHIEGSNLQFISTSKCFGRNMMKYFNPKGYQQVYNIEIFEDTPINCFIVNDNESHKVITLQEFQNSNNNEFVNFSIDFSNFLGGRGDKEKDGSLKGLINKMTNDDQKRKIWLAKIGSIYDQEVILYTNQYVKCQKYCLSKEAFTIMMIAYEIIFDDLKTNASRTTDITSLVRLLCSSDTKDTIFLFVCFKTLLLSNDEDIDEKPIIEILKTVDFDNEHKYPIQYSNGEYSDFTKIFEPLFQNFINDGSYGLLKDLLKGCK